MYEEARDVIRSEVKFSMVYDEDLSGLIAHSNSVYRLLGFEVSEEPSQK